MPGRLVLFFGGNMKVELLAPGGTYDSVIAALNAGADAVYTGGEKFGARAFADNLSTEQLLSVLDYAHIHNKKIYLTINTLLKDQEIDADLYEYLKPLYEHGLDAVIVQDFGVMKFIRENFPKLHIHASTQMTIMGEKTVQELENLGITRIVTPRELSLKEIKEIKKNANTQIESFVHGALCYCYSGQCFLSSYIGGRSGNRGKCAQPCRMEYDVISNNNIINNKNEKYILSPKDMCTIKILPEIIESGVYSLKIEGRMKKKEYTAGVVSIYRKYLDLYLEKGKDFYNVNQSDIDLLSDLFNRNGFNESYYKQHNGRNMISLAKPGFRSENKNFTDEIRSKYIDNLLKKPVDIVVVIKKDKNITAYATTDNINVKVEDAIPMSALNKPLDNDMVIKQMSKLGNTNYLLNSIEVNLDSGLFVTIGQLNYLRRNLIEKLEKMTLCRYRRESDSLKEEKTDFHKSEAKDKLCINILVNSIKQVKHILSYNYISSVYIECHALSAKDLMLAQKECRKRSVKLIIAMPYTFRLNDKKVFSEKFGGILNIFDGFLIRNIEEYFYLKDIGIAKNCIFDYNVYTNNSYAKKYAYSLGAEKLTSPLELNYKELLKRDCSGEEMIVYGNMPVMVSANCLINTCKGCNNKGENIVLKDRKSEKFNVQCICDYCYNIIYNSKPLSLAKYADDIMKLGIHDIRINFTDENVKEIINVMTKIENSFIQHRQIVEDDSSTRGHFKRGVK